jgi:hypothetical protein
MNDNTFSSLAPSFLGRAVTFLVLWFTVFGSIIAMARLPMEAGSDRAHEDFGAALCSPLLGIMGLALFLGGEHPYFFAMIISLVIIVGTAAWMLFRCRTAAAFWTLVFANSVVITVSAVGFCQQAWFWSGNP